MNNDDCNSAGDHPIVIHLPLAIRRRGGRKIVVAPDGTHVSAAPAPYPNNSLVKAIARGYRWQRLLEDGTYATLKDLAAAEKISPSYISRLLQLTLLSPDLVEQALDRPGEFDVGSIVRREVSQLWNDHLPRS